MEQCRPAQKFSLFVAMLSYLAAIGCVVATFYWGSQFGRDHPVVASFAASVVFFVGTGIVLHVIGRADLPNLKIGG